MSLRSLKLAVSIALPLASAWTVAACGAARPQVGSSGSGDYRGTVTFSNRSSTPVCHIEATPASRSAQIHVDQRVEPGQSATFEASNGVSQTWALLVAASGAMRSPGHPASIRSHRLSVEPGARRCWSASARSIPRPARPTARGSSSPTRTQLASRARAMP